MPVRLQQVSGVGSSEEDVAAEARVVRKAPGGRILRKGWQVFVNKWLQRSPDVPGTVLFVLILSLGFN